MTIVESATRFRCLDTGRDQGRLVDSAFASENIINIMIWERGSNMGEAMLRNDTGTLKGLPVQPLRARDLQAMLAALSTRCGCDTP
jgi:hypothetical protein